MIRKQHLLTIILVVVLLLAGCRGDTEPAPDSGGPADEDSEPESEVPTQPRPTETHPPPTNTPIPKPTNTPILEPTITATPETDPRQVLGDSAWGAIFIDDTQTWYQYQNEQSSAQVKDGQLVVTDYKANSYDSWSMSYPVVDDFYLEVTLTTGEACAGKDRFGFLFRAPDPSQGYLFNLSCDGAYQLRIWDGETFSDLIKWTDDEHIIHGPEITHRIGVTADGNQLSLYVNGFKINEVSDSTYAEGTFGINTAAVETEGFSVYVTEAKLWELPEESED